MFWKFYGEFSPYTIKVPYAILKLCLFNEYIEILIYVSKFLIQLEKQHLSYNLEAPHELKNGSSIKSKWVSHIHVVVGFLLTTKWPHNCDLLMSYHNIHVEIKVFFN